MKACTIGARHQWDFVKNINRKKIRQTASGIEVDLRIVGLYRCLCGETKYGTYRPVVTPRADQEGGVA